MKITVTTTIDTDDIQESKSRTVTDSELAELDTWRAMTNQVEVDALKGNFDTSLITQQLWPSKWILTKVGRERLINALLKVSDESDTEIAFGLSNFTIGGKETHELSIIVQPSNKQPDYYIIREKINGPTGTLPTITPHPPRIDGPAGE